MGRTDLRQYRSEAEPDGRGPVQDQIPLLVCLEAMA